jgi:iron(III) transport system substrate-binding protein
MKILSFIFFLLLTSTASAQSITVYSAGPNDLIQILAKEFEKNSGTKVQVFQGTTGQIMARLEAERSNPVADVVISASWDSATALKKAGDLLAYSPAGAEHVPDFLKDSHYIAQGVTALALVWNNKSKTPKPTDWNDLTHADYRRQILMPDPAQSGAAFEWLGGMLTAQGETATWDFLGKLRSNGMLVSGPNARALNPVLQGAKAAAIGAVDYIAYSQQASGEAIDIIFPSSGTVIAPRPIMILNYSKQPEQAKAFVDYLLSEDGQTAVANAFLIPARQDIPGRRPGLNDIALIKIDSSALEARRAEILNQFRKVTR